MTREPTTTRPVDARPSSSPSQHAGHSGGSGERPYRDVLETLLGVPFTPGNRLRVLRNGVEIYPAMLDAVRRARRSIDFLTYAWWRGDVAREMAEALAGARKRGAEVRVVLDAVGSVSIPRELVALMTEAGVRVEWFRPKSDWRFWKIDHRTHRKILVVDGDVGFTGGAGIGGEWKGDARGPDEWRDTHFEIRGPAIRGLRAAFAKSWLAVGGRIEDLLDVVPAPDPEGEIPIQVIQSDAAVERSDVAVLFRSLVALARERIRIATAYFVPDPLIREELVRARQRGVEVEIIFPGPHTDQRIAQLSGSREYGALLTAGVRLWAYQPTMFHVKAITVDGVLSCVGSANFNQRSMGRDDELSLVIADPRTTALLDGHFEDDRAQSRAIEAASWSKRGLVRRTAEALADLVRPQT